MKTKFIVMAAMAALFSMGFTACSNNDEDLTSKMVDSQSVMGFSVNANGNLITRGVETNATNALSQITSFQTWGYDDTTDGLYMGVSAAAGREVSNTGTALAPTWTYTPQQFWPVHPLNFVAVTPVAAPTGGTLTHATASDANVVTITSTFVNPTDVENQVDLMYAKADGITKSTSDANVPFTFGHALSQILFKGKFDGNGAVTKVTIAEISLCNINQAGTLVYTSEGTWYGGNAQPATSGTPVNFTLEAGDLEGSVFEAADYHHNAVLYTAEDEAENPEHVAGTVKTPAYEEAFDLTIENDGTKKNAWFMVPQTTAAWAGPAAINATPASGAYLKVRAQLEKDDVVILGNAAADALYIPLPVNWDRSKKYIYTLIFNGANALTPITFSVAAENWTPMEPQPDPLNF